MNDSEIMIKDFIHKYSEVILPGSLITAMHSLNWQDTLTIPQLFYSEENFHYLLMITINKHKLGNDKTKLNVHIINLYQ